MFESACHGCLGPVVSVNTAYANLGGALTFSLQLGVSCAEGGCPARHVTRTAFCHAGTCARHDVEHGTTTDVVTTAAELALPPERELLAGALVHVARHEAACGRGSAPPADLGEVPAPYACRELAPCYAIIDRLPCTPTLDFSFLQTLDADPACRAALAACTTPRHDGGSSNASE